MTITMLAGPIIGAVIGYCTNYIAVKMLFRPLNPIMIGKFRLPFTPGIIPKGRGRLAKALGQAVGQTLLTPEDIEKMLLQEEISNKISEELIGYLENETKSLKELSLESLDEKSYNQISEKIKEQLTNKILDGIEGIDIGEIISTQGLNAVKEAVAGTMMAMFVSDKVLESFVEPIKERINNYILVNGPSIVGELVDKEVNEFVDYTPSQVLEQASIEKNELKQVINKIYTKLMKAQASKLLQQANISEVVEQKINEMDILEIEELVLSVMKKELSAVVNLGALIGFILGLLNMLF
ncbi:putative membrane associated protein [Lachnospiraceae bacterium TWA4]|nr:putative membrane associated protein [Lachnospiraceae bacterium TWA4]